MPHGIPGRVPSVVRTSETCGGGTQRKYERTSSQRGGSSLKGLSNAPHLPGCRVVNDGAPFVKFSGPGDCNQSNPPPAASYIIDNSDFSHSTLPLATECQRNQNFFQLYNLDAPYIVDYIWLCGTTDVVTSSGSPQGSEPGSGRTAGSVIIGVTVGGVSLLLGLAILPYFVRMKTRKQVREFQTEQTGPCCASTENPASQLSSNPSLHVVGGDGNVPPSTQQPASPSNESTHAEMLPPGAENPEDTELPPPYHSLV
ncbi:hypothetical protein L227DRAFT_567002 [Lentinus tigrinus ALCF2SS1-6]|uniref:Uncharacterized protein n=1 Tax=Lentinus tigrinus ALCF2SS1-6 TaxID=1328759 RepID=A0A5C2RUQ0_9APHY|nr:hypothetical protein L227DRAFT_567002 [Lentinus tigrinus ALCF2SS1-6]